MESDILEPLLAGAVWSPCRLRQPHSCERCGRALGAGSLAYRPVLVLSGKIEAEARARVGSLRVCHPCAEAALAFESA